MQSSDFRRRAALVREIPLEVVLTAWEAVPDLRDRSQWRTEKGPLTITGSTFFNWHRQTGGGGAIDLVMHLLDCDARCAVEWLWPHRGQAAPTHGARARVSPQGLAQTSPSPRGSLGMPPRSDPQFTRVRTYLHDRRGLSLTIIDALRGAGRLYADPRGNAVFVMVAGQPPRTVGAELRGTTSRIWHGLAPGSRRDAGYFWFGDPSAKQIVLCESAIDAASCYELHHRIATTDTLLICISTAGVRSDAPWLAPLLTRGYLLSCGFDNDDAGNTAASRMMARYPTIHRLLATAHDWNDALRAQP